MNKFVFFFILFLSLGACDGFSNFLNKLAEGAEKVSKITNQVSDVVSKTSKTIDIASSLISGIVADSKVVTEEVMKLGENLQAKFNDIATNFKKIINNSKKFAEAAYTDGKQLYKDLKKQLDVNIAAAQADINASLESAKNTIAQFGSDVQLVYRDGKIIVKQIGDAADLKQIVSDVKAKNKENLEAAVASINDAISKANALLGTSKDYLEAYRAIAEDMTLDAKTKAEKIIKNLQLYVQDASVQLKKFIEDEKKSLTKILKKAEILAKNSKDMVEQITSTISTVANVVDKNVKNVNNGISEIKGTWEKKADVESDTENDDDDDATPQERINKAIDNVKNNIDKTKGSVAEATTTIQQTSQEIKSAVKDVKEQIVNFKYKVSANKLNIRSGPSTSYPVVGSLSKGKSVSVEEVKEKFARIGEDKWVSMNYLKVDDSEAAEDVASTKASVTKAMSTLKAILAMF
jgi:hypothetical protein